MKRIRKVSHSLPSGAGFTLAELLVAAAIASLAILVLVGVLRKGIEISETTQHRQRARAIIDSCFESPTYQCGNFMNIPADQATVIIDPRPTGNLTGILTIAINPSTHPTPLSPVNDQVRNDVACKTVTMTVTWEEPQGQESVMLEKTLTKLDF
ncbi:MAG: hypothetical protein JXA71_12905 [Chitinispirillaceae bacterium]|nr:hypothetical protein [Chitinispirillaceae bacterium]